MKEFIQQTLWPTNSELLEHAQQLELAFFHEVLFSYSQSPSSEESLSTTTSHYVNPPKAWAQAFLENLYIGNVYTVYGHYDSSNQYPKFDLIIDLSMTDFEQHVPPITMDKNHYRIPLPDTGSNFVEIVEELQRLQIFKKIAEFRREGKKVLINCHMGMSRSATVAILFLMETYQISLIQAYHYLQKIRPIVLPNPGYFSCLLEYEHKLQVEYPLKAVAKTWLEDYLDDHNLDAFILEEQDNAVLVTEKEGSNELGNPFNDLVSFLKMMEIPFIVKDSTIFNGRVQLAPHDFEQFACLIQNKGIKAVDSSFLDQTNYSDAVKALEIICEELSINKELYKFITKFRQHGDKQEWGQAFECLTSFAKIASLSHGCMKFFPSPQGQSQLVTALFTRLEQSGLRSLVEGIKSDLGRDRKEAGELDGVISYHKT